MIVNTEAKSGAFLNFSYLLLLDAGFVQSLCKLSTSILPCIGGPLRENKVGRARAQ